MPAARRLGGSPSDGTVAPAVSDGGWSTLTGAELRVVSCIVRGMTNRATAEELVVSRHTVDAHLKHVFLKLGIHSRVELAVLAVRSAPAGVDGQA